MLTWWTDLLTAGAVGVVLAVALAVVVLAVAVLAVGNAVVWTAVGVKRGVRAVTRR